MKKTKSILSLVLVLVFLFSVPIVSKATIYEGYVGGNYYKCTVTGSTSYIYSKIKYDPSASLKVMIDAEVYYMFMGEAHYYNNVQDQKTSNSTSVTFNRTYLDFYNDPNISIPANGFFARCTYDSKIGTTMVICGVLEVFYTV